jgi:CheY-like chemotaxis protein
MLHILLVEDNTADVFMVREAIRLSSVKADVLIAYDGEQAIRILEELPFKPDFILLDLNVPKLDGLELLARYRENLAAPVVILTSSMNPKDRERALELGAHEYVSKPVLSQEFINTVQSMLERWMGGSAPVSGLTLRN